jgi:hypothetical protein
MGAWCSCAMMPSTTARGRQIQDKQKDVARYIQSADTEIALAASKHEKLQQLKSVPINDLLTGRIRVQEMI